MILCILGRQPAISLAELEARYGSSSVTSLTNQVAQVDATQLPIDEFGGLLKVIEIINPHVPSEQKLIQQLLENLRGSESKISVGLSWYGTRRSIKSAFALALEVKKQARQSRSLALRIVPNKALELSTAQVLHNKLLEPPNAEFVIVETGQETVLGRTISMQDIEQYGRRDHGRPARDARVGMLPPKLAQIMLNLAVGQIKQQFAIGNSQLGRARQPTPDSQLPAPTILDCFCGTGVVLQEALLLGYRAIGSDLEPRLVEMSRTNLEWLAKNYQIQDGSWELMQGDARKMQWQPPIDAVVSELYLGPPLSQIPPSAKLEAIRREVDGLLKSTLVNLAAQISLGTMLCLAVPAWRSQNKQLTHLPILDRLEELGYTRQVFKHASNQDLVYFRPDQIVARELLVLTRK